MLYLIALLTTGLLHRGRPERLDREAGGVSIEMVVVAVCLFTLAMALVGALTGVFNGFLGQLTGGGAP